jgi:hypothetical protein
VADLASLCRRVNAATPPDRDRAVDALRAVAIAGVVLGHWLVTAVVVDGVGQLRGDSPLRAMPALIPVSWLLQTLAVFFLVGGYVGARSHRARKGPYRAWLARRLTQLFRPVAAVLAIWGLAVAGLLVVGAPYETIRTLLTLVLSPLWFLLVFALLTAATPIVSRLGSWSPVLALAAVAGCDAARFALGAPAWLGWSNVAAGWLVPYGLGVAWALGGFPERRTAATLLVGGVLGTAALVLWCGYPASMVGIPGAPVSNLNPPTLAAVAFGSAQCGLAVLLYAPLRRAMRYPIGWAVVAVVNLSAMAVFLWHQTGLLVVTAVGLFLGRLPGLHTSPDSPGWLLARLGWLPVFTAVLIVLVRSFRRA